MAFKSPANQWFYDRLEENRLSFENEMTINQNQLLVKCKRFASLMEEKKMKSRARKSIHERVRTMLRMIDSILGTEVLLLCFLSSSVDNFITLDKVYLLEDIKMWWIKSTQPPLLVKAALALSENIPATNFSIRTRKDAVKSSFELKDLIKFLTQLDAGNDKLAQFVVPYDASNAYAEIRISGVHRDEVMRFECSSRLASEWLNFLVGERSGSTVVQESSTYPQD